MGRGRKTHASWEESERGSGRPACGDRDGEKEVGGKGYKQRCVSEKEGGQMGRLLTPHGPESVTEGWGPARGWCPGGAP